MAVFPALRAGAFSPSTAFAAAFGAAFSGFDAAAAAAAFTGAALPAAAFVVLTGAFATASVISGETFAAARAALVTLGSAATFAAGLFADAFGVPVFLEALLLTVLFDACKAWPAPARAATDAFFAEVAAGVPADRDAVRAAGDTACLPTAVALALAGGFADAPAGGAFAPALVVALPAALVVGLVPALVVGLAVALFAAWAFEGFAEAFDAAGRVAALATGLAVARAAVGRAAALAAARVPVEDVTLPRDTELACSAFFLPTALLPTITFLVPTASPFVDRADRDSKIEFREIE